MSQSKKGEGKKAKVKQNKEQKLEPSRTSDVDIIGYITQNKFV